MRQAGKQLEDIDWVGHSTCCDSKWQSDDDVIDDLCDELSDTYQPNRIRDHFAGRVKTIDHHESHAMLAFAASGSQRALVCVVDGMGNRLGSDGAFNPDSDWWKGRFQRQTYYVAQWRDSFVCLTKVHEEAHREGEIGLGELYRALTHYLGWSTYQHAGKAMALAAFGNPDALQQVNFVEIQDDCMCVRLNNAHDTPLEQIDAKLARAGVIVPNALKRPATPESGFLCDLAALVQHQLEQAVINVVGRLAEEHDVVDVCFAGGVALNCLAMGRLRGEKRKLRVHVAPAPADSGQGLGNALWLALNEQSPAKTKSNGRFLVRPDLGPDYAAALWDEAVSNLCDKHARVRARKYEDDAQMARAVAALLGAGQIVGLRRGRAEYGPRALGRSSILGDPRSPDTHRRVNAIKCREPFRPYAPSILEELCDDYIVASGPSPFMSFAGPVRKEMRPRIPAVVHADGTARYHTVSRQDGFYRQIVESFAALTGVPILLNTSLNLDGMPIAETPIDCVNLFQHSGMRVLAADRWIIEKTE